MAVKTALGLVFLAVLVLPLRPDDTWARFVDGVLSGWLSAALLERRA